MTRPRAERRPTAIGLSGRRLAKNTLSLVLTFGLAALIGGAAQVAVARILGPHGLGVFGPAWQLAVVVSVAGLLGIDQLMIRELNRGGASDVLGRTLGLGIALGATLCVVASAAWLVGLRTDLTAAFAVAGLYVLVSAPAWLLRSGFHARERMELETFTILVEAVVSLGGVAAVLVAGLDAPAVLAALVAGRAANLAAAAVASRKLWGPVGVRFVPSTWGQTLRASLPLGVTFVFTTMLLRFDIVLAGAFLTDRQAGLYAATAAVTFTIPTMAAAFNRSLYPVLARTEGRHDRQLQRVFDTTWHGLIVAGLAGAAVMTALSEPAMVFVFGEDFASSAPLLAAMSWLLPVRFLNNLSAMTLNATEWPKRAAIATGVVIIANQITYLVLIPRFGAWGAVYAALGAETTLMVILVAALRPLRPPLARPVVHGIVTATASAVTAAAIPGDVILRGTCAGVVLVVFTAVGLVRNGSRRGTA